MKEVEYLIVGFGLAGISLAEHLLENGKSFLVLEDGKQGSSTVAGGMYNPVILKRFTPAWRATEQLQYALPFYKRIEQRLDISVNQPMPIYRKFASVEEQNMWFEASDKPALQPYLSTQIIKNTNAAIKAETGFGKVLHTGKIDTQKLQHSYRSYLDENDFILTEMFDYSVLKIKENSIQYKNIKAKQVVFTEGFGLKNNPFFNTLPLVGSKGELLTIEAPELQIDFVLKSSVFLIPLGNNLYNVGATYNRNDKSTLPTVEGREELLAKLNTLINCNYKVVNHKAGIRPTVKDRRPLVGQHAKYKNLYVLNGLGSRGVIIGPWVAQHLYNFIENKIPLDKEISIARF